LVVPNEEASAPVTSDTEPTTNGAVPEPELEPVVAAEPTDPPELTVVGDDDLLEEPQAPRTAVAIASNIAPERR
jgi:hypothetical protein